MKKLNEITDDDVIFCQQVLDLNAVPDLNYTKRIIARIFTEGMRLTHIRGIDIIKIYNHLKDKYELPV